MYVNIGYLRFGGWFGNCGVYEIIEWMVKVSYVRVGVLMVIVACNNLGKGGMRRSIVGNTVYVWISVDVL